MPDDWHQIIYAVIEYWPAGVEKTTTLETELRQIDFRLCGGPGQYTREQGKNIRERL
ncbi:MAG TPA: hypothetical protein VK578_22060 [Edaphobacter sp.]|nr:hypothetical protein [Edaphobacter sp.]